MKKLRTADASKYISKKGFTEFILDDDNTDCFPVGIKQIMTFNDVKICEFPDSIMFTNKDGFLSITGIKEISMNDHVLGTLMRITTTTGNQLTVICR